MTFIADRTIYLPLSALRDRGYVEWCSWQGRFANRPYVRCDSTRPRRGQKRGWKMWPVSGGWPFQ